MNIRPTGTPIMSASNIATILGGITCPNVPEAATVPQASDSSYLCFSIVGKAITPSVTTVAPTTPVLAASIAPTSITAVASPPGLRPKIFARDSSNSSATLDLSKIIPININNGTASRVKFVIIPKIL